jgi:hypothetical protein
MINKRTLGGIASAALMLLAWQPLSAAGGSMRCGNDIIQSGGRSGPGKYEVLKKCGEPAFRQGNTWVYDEGDDHRKVFIFNSSGLLTSIRDAGR